MTKVVITKIPREKLAGSSSRLTIKRVRGENGKQSSLFVVDSNDDNFDNDLARVFSLNVDKARKANTAIFGSPDGPRGSAGKLKRKLRKLK